MKNKLLRFQVIVSIFVAMALIFMTYQYSKLRKDSQNEYSRLSSITYQSLKKLDGNILDEFLSLEKDGLTAEDVYQINSKILEKQSTIK